MANGGMIGEANAMKAELLYPARAVLAEGPVWHDGRVWWVDIERGEVHALDPADGRDRAWRLPYRVGFVIPTVRGDCVVGTEQGVERFDPATGALSPWVHPERDRAGNRFNDAKCDPAGRLWAGTMGISEAPELGSLYRFETNARCTRMVDRITVSNGLAWSADGRTLYYIDSPTRRVDAFEFDPATGDLGARRTVVTVTDGFPDGMCIDDAGNLWIALWGGWGVACHDPRNGKLLARVEVPVEAVSSCCFGEGGDLYITTASRDVTDATRGRQPEAGSLFRVRLPVTGPHPPRFGG